MKRSVFIASGLLLFALTHDASAQGFINPFVGTTLTSPSKAGSSSKPGVGIAFGGVGKIIGGETEIAYYPEVLDNTANALEKSKVFTFSGNTIIGPTIGHVKPYGAIGVGSLYLNVTSASSIVVPNPESISKNYFTFNAGGGVMGFFTSHLGVRGDLRYYRAFGFKMEDVESSGLALDRFDFWRANVGLVAKF
jgi:opacity protein-like surface antigen